MLTLKFNNLYIEDWFSIAGTLESEGNINNADMYLNNFYYGEKTHEDAEIKMQKTVINNLKNRNKIDVIIGGNLSNQLGTMNIALSNEEISFLGLYNACATFTEAAIISGLILQKKEVSNCLLLTSSHTLTSERQFRYPNEYGSLKKSYQTNTITCAIGVIVTNKKTKYKINSGTIGRVVDYGVKDANNMGAIMAPSAASVIASHLTNTKTTIDDYDYILTGDLGSVGLALLQSILESDYGIKTNKIIDAGSMIYKKSQKKGAGGSGPTCLPFVFFNKLIKNKKIKKVLLVGTGALHNSTLVNQKNSIPSIAHLIEIEGYDDN